MGIIDPTTGRPVRPGNRAIMYAIVLNLESGTAEIMCNAELVNRIPPAERRRLYNECLKDLPLALKVPTDA